MPCAEIIADHGAEDLAVTLGRSDVRSVMSAVAIPRAAPVLAAVALAISFLSGCLSQPPKEASTTADRTTEEQPVRPCPGESTRQLEFAAIELLDDGAMDDARHLLDCAIRQKPGSRRAKLLIEQLEADPIEYLGSRHYLYTVKPGETLSKIAEERLDDGLKFVILAKYNNIPVPANLVAGQRIKVPGDRPPPRPPAPTETAPTTEHMPPPDAPAPEADESQQAYADALSREQQGDLIGAYEALARLVTAGAEIPDLDEDLLRVKSALIAELEDTAYGLELAGKPAEALATWRQVLDVDPANIPAQLSIRRLEQ
jgi:hypothetical protein